MYKYTAPQAAVTQASILSMMKESVFTCECVYKCVYEWGKGKEWGGELHHKCAKDGSMAVGLQRRARWRVESRFSSNKMAWCGSELCHSAICALEVCGWMFVCGLVTRKRVREKGRKGVNRHRKRPTGNSFYRQVATRANQVGQAVILDFYLTICGLLALCVGGKLPQWVHTTSHFLNLSMCLFG